MKKIPSYFVLAALICSAAMNQVYAGDSQPCGNDSAKGPAGLTYPATDDPVVLYTGNDFRTNTELKVYGGVGEHQLTWTRYVNSRATNGGQYFGTIGMRHSYQWEMADAGLNASNQAQLTINYPDGAGCTFAQISGTEWHSTHSITDILYQNGNLFTLQRKNGWKYYFSKLTDGNGGVYYQLTSFADSHQSLYTLTYDASNRLVKVTEPAGRWLQINYQDLPVTQVDFVTLASVASVPLAGQWTQLTVNDPGSYRYLRYVGPDGSHSPVAEIQFIAAGSTAPLTGTPFGTGPAYARGMEYDKAFDGNVGTGFFAKSAYGAFAGIDLGAGNAKKIGLVKFYPSAGNESKMYQPQTWLQSGVFQGSNLLPLTTSVISSVQTSDGRIISYNYTSFKDSLLPSLFQLLSSVNYDDGAVAAYTYTQIFQGTRPLVATASEPRNQAPYAMVKNNYFGGQTETLGMLQTQTNLSTGETLSTIGISNNNLHSPAVTYSGGQTTSYYMTNGLPTFKADALGKTSSFAYDQSNSGFLTTTTDPLGRVTKRTYTKYNNDLTHTFPDGTSDSYTRDANDQILSYKDGRGKSSTVSRDAQERITGKTNFDGSTETWTYNSFNQPLTHTLANGSVTSSTYDARGLKTSDINPLGDSTSYAYDGYDRLSASTDALGKTTQFAYDAQGKVTKVTYADGKFTSYVYDPFGNLTQTTNELGNSWKRSYDAIRRLVSVTDPLGRTSAYIYPDAAAREPSLITLPSGKKSAYSYDANGRVVSRTIGYGSTEAAATTCAYDAAGNMTGLTDPNGRTSLYTYDSRNRLATSADPLGNTIRCSYDATGNQVSITRPDGGVVSNVYDAMNRLTRSTDPKAQVTNTTYDAAGNQASMQDAKGNTYSYTYDSMNRRTAMIYPGGSREFWSYNAAGQPATATTRGGQVCTYSYDNRNRNTGYVWSDGTPGSTKAYDAAGRLLTNNNGISSLSYTYDAANHVLSETQAVAGQPARSVTYAYDTDSNRTGLTNPDGSAITYSYTGRNQVAGVSADGPPPMATYTYDGNGNRLSKTLESGAVTSYVYDAASRLTSVAHTAGGGLIASDGYTLNAMGNRTSRAETTATGTNTDAYSYDAVDQVTGVGYGSGRTVGYAYDPVGNRTGVTDSGTTTPYTANALNQYQSVGTQALGYDPKGNLATVSGWTYGYDAQNRMVSASNGVTAETFAYDACNRCVSRTVNGTATYFAYDGWDLVAEYDSTGAEQASYVHGPVADEMLCRTSPSGPLYYHQDGNNNVVALTNGSGSLVERYTYDVFGTVTIRDGSNSLLTASAAGNRFLFTGREYLAELGFYDYRNRMYSAWLGRFMQTDPIRFDAGDVNIYRYCGNDVATYIDAYGLFSWGEFGTEASGRLAGGLAGGVVGRVGGQWLGGAVGAVLGGGPEDLPAVAAGVYIGGKLGNLAGNAAGATLGGIAGSAVFNWAHSAATDPGSDTEKEKGHAKPPVKKPEPPAPPAPQAPPTAPKPPSPPPHSNIICPNMDDSSSAGDGMI